MFQVLVDLGASYTNVDAFTRGFNKFGYAQDHIEETLGFVLATSVEVEMADGWVPNQAVEYESRTKYCSHCSLMTHFTGNCEDLKGKCVEKNARVK